MTGEQGQQCVFCLISEGKIQSAQIYNDNEVMAFLEIRPATKGHAVVISKTHAPLLSTLPPQVFTKMFSIAFSMGGNFVKKLGATGVSYLVNEGAGADQRVAHASIQVIPRYENDGVTIGWQDKELSQEEISAYLQNIISKLSSKEEATAPQAQASQPEPKQEEPEEEIEVQERVPRYW